MKPVTDRETLLPLITGVILIYLLYIVGQSWKGLFQIVSPRPTTAIVSPRLAGDCSSNSQLSYNPLNNHVDLPVTEGTPVPYSDVAITITTMPSVTMLARWGAGENGKYTWGQGEGKTMDIALNPFLGVVAIAGESGFKMRQLSDGAITCYEGLGRNITEIAMSSDGKWLAVKPLGDGVEVWDLHTHSLAYEFPNIHNAKNLEFHPNDGVLGMIQKKGFNEPATIVLQDVTTMQEINRFEQAGATDLRFANEPQNLSLVVTMPQKIEIRTFQADSEIIPLTQESSGGISLFHPNGYQLLFVRLSNVQLRDIKSGEVVWQKDWARSQVQDVAFSSNGEWFATVHQDGMLRLWDASDGRIVMELAGQISAGTGAEISPDTTYILTSNLDGTVAVWGIP